MAGICTGYFSSYGYSLTMIKQWNGVPEIRIGETQTNGCDLPIGWEMPVVDLSTVAHGD